MNLKFLPTHNEKILLKLLKKAKEGLYAAQVAKKQDAVTQNAVYIILKRLESKKYVRIKLQSAKSENKRPRSMYHITKAGKQALKNLKQMRKAEKKATKTNLSFQKSYNVVPLK